MFTKNENNNNKTKINKSIQKTTKQKKNNITLRICRDKPSNKKK